MDSVYQKLVRGCRRIIEKDKEKLSVSSLCRAADISRTAFYIYYDDLNSFILDFEKTTSNKMFEQAERILLCDDRELFDIVKKENLLVNEDEIFLIKYIDSENRYISLSEVSYNCLKAWDYGRLKPEKNLKEFVIFFNGFITVMYHNILNYDKEIITKEMKMSRICFDILMKA